eukprot:scaffold225822_cov30-Tisochrysis_lutea.AAC.1
MWSVGESACFSISICLRRREKSARACGSKGIETGGAARRPCTHCSRGASGRIGEPPRRKSPPVSERQIEKAFVERVCCASAVSQEGTRPLPARACKPRMPSAR